MDTEADSQGRNEGKIFLKNIKYLPRFQNLCAKYEFKPTYLVSYEVACNQDSISELKKWQNDNLVEIGAHLHPWTTPPFSVCERNKKIERVFPNELDDSELFGKLKSLTNKLEESFGCKPKSFRAGRWGVDNRIMNYLIKLGYIADCSVTPKINWKTFKGKSDGIGGPDFRSFPASPYYIFSNDSAGRILEVPVSILYCGFFMENSRISRIFSLLDASFKKMLMNKLLFHKKWCRIFPETKIGDLKKVADAAERNSLPHLEFMIHSSELMPGGTSYFKTEKDVQDIYIKLENFFKYLVEKGVKGITLSEFASLFSYENGRCKKNIQ